MNPSGVKYSASKIDPHLDFRAGTTSEDPRKVYKNRDTYLGTWTIRTLYSGGALEILNQKLDLH